MRDSEVGAEVKAAETARRRYNRIASIYDLMEGVIERSLYSKWRSLLWSRVEGRHILEVGVGTGKNFPYYPGNAEVTAIDLSEKMLERAEARARKEGVKVHLRQMDVQDLEFEDSSFDTAVATFVFCSVPDPVAGLMELERVCKPGGKVVLLEHVLSNNPILSWLMNLANPLVVRIAGANINRKTVEPLAKSGVGLDFWP